MTLGSVYRVIDMLLDEDVNMHPMGYDISHLEAEIRRLNQEAVNWRIMGDRAMFMSCRGDAGLLQELVSLLLVGDLAKAGKLAHKRMDRGLQKRIPARLFAKITGKWLAEK